MKALLIGAIIIILGLVAFFNFLESSVPRFQEDQTVDELEEILDSPR